MADKFSPISTGDEATSTKVNSLFSSLQTEVNALPITAIQPGSLHDVHLPSLVVDSGTDSITGTHNYTNQYPGWGNSGIVIGANATGWSIINTGGTAGSGTDLEVDLGADYVLTGSNAGLLIMFNTNVVALDDTTTATGTSTLYGLFKIQIYANGAWRSIQRTERYTTAEMQYGPGISGTLASAQASLSKDVPIRTFISNADLATPGHVVRKVRVLTCISRKLAAAGSTQLSLKETNLSVMLIHASLQESL